MPGRRLIIPPSDIVLRNDISKGDFDLYIILFRTTPQLKTLLFKSFREVVLHLYARLDENNDHEGLFDIYKQTVSIYPDCPFIYNAMGRFLLKNCFYMEAWNQFQQILDRDPSSVNAENQLNIVKSSLIQRWHYRMLNDNIRNTSYRAAIHESVKPQIDSVLDLGAGTGLLAAYAAECNPVAIVGIELSKVLCDIAECVMRDNNIQSVKIVNKLSHNVNDYNINGKKTLVVTELFDAGLFGESIIASLDHAFKNLLIESGRVIPTRAEFLVQGIQCDSLNGKYVLSAHAKAFLNIPFNENILVSHSSYDCGDIQLYNDLKYMTMPSSLVKVDFNNPADLEAKLNHTEQYSVELRPVDSGTVSTIIGWFTLSLTDNVTLTTDPTSEQRARAWQQAIFCTFLPKQVEENKPFTVNFELINGSKLSLLPDSDCSMKISESTMRFLNDRTYVDLIRKSVKGYFWFLKNLVGKSNIVVADLLPFPIFGLMFLKRGAKLLYCWASTIEDQVFFEKVFEANGINKERYKFIDSELHVSKEIRIHALCHHIFDDKGSFDTIQIKNVDYIERVNLIPAGIVMPYRIKVMCQLINSPLLDTCNRVDDKHTAGYKVSQHINKFQVSVNYGIDFTHFEYTALADPIDLGLWGEMKSRIFNCQVLKCGCVNAILCWYVVDMLIEDDCQSMNTNRSNCCIDGTAFLVDPERELTAGNNIDVVCCVDEDESFKLIIDVDV